MTKKSNAAGRDRLSRLFLWLDKNLADLERASRAHDENSSPGDLEKEARTMISLMRVLEKIGEMKERLDEKSQGDQAFDKTYNHEETERRRIEIAQRIDRLQRQHKKKN